ncbi:MAG: hypothetical protein AAB521_04135 [Patescibacteria group bacterium]
MRSIGELVKGRPTAAEQQREQTKGLFNEITELAPKVGYDYYVSSSLAKSLISSSVHGGVAKIAADSLNLKETDLLCVNWNPYRSPGTLLIHDNSNGTRDFAIDFDRKTFRMEGVIIEGKPFHNKDQTLLHNLLESIRDDLDIKRKEWKKQMIRMREEFYNKLTSVEDLAVRRVAFGLAHSIYSDSYFSVFGVIEDEDKDQEDKSPKKIRLFTTTQLTNRIARDIISNVNSTDETPVETAHYREDLLSDASYGDPKIIITSPDFHITVENFWPAKDTSNNYTLLRQSHNEITEGLFDGFMAGKNRDYRPLTSPDQAPILIEKFEDGQSFFDA